MALASMDMIHPAAKLGRCFQGEDMVIGVVRVTRDLAEPMSLPTSRG